MLGRYRYDGVVVNIGIPPLRSLSLRSGRNDKVTFLTRYNTGMSVVEDVRKLLQDLVTPEMRALAVKVDALDNKVETLRKDMNEKIETFRAEMNRRFDYLETSFRLDERVSTLEEERRKERHKQ
jgi:hypothetical protein